MSSLKSTYERRVDRVQPSGDNSGSGPVAVDAHVHLYSWMSVSAALDAAGRNLARIGRDGGGVREGCLFVADPEGVDGFARLCSGDDTGDWRREGVADGEVFFRHPDGFGLLAVRGQQLITSEGLEVLGIGCGQKLASGRPLSGMVEDVRAAGGLSIVAWGVGKWLGKRGRTVIEMIAREGGSEDVMLGDNGGRPWFWSRVPQFDAACESGMRVLAGTDPLPLAGELSRIGSYGFRVEADSLASSGFKTLRRVLAGGDNDVATLGRRMGVGGFLSNQLRLRLRRDGQGGPS